MEGNRFKKRKKKTHFCGINGRYKSGSWRNSWQRWIFHAFLSTRSLFFCVCFFLNFEREQQHEQLVSKAMRRRFGFVSLDVTSFVPSFTEFYWVLPFRWAQVRFLGLGIRFLWLREQFTITAGFFFAKIEWDLWRFSLIFLVIIWFDLIFFGFYWVYNEFHRVLGYFVSFLVGWTGFLEGFFGWVCGRLSGFNLWFYWVKKVFQ